MRCLLVLILSLSCKLVADVPQPGAPPEQELLQQFTPSLCTENDISLTAEGLPSSFVNHVNTIFGNFLLPTVDFVIPGPTPLPLIRYYNSESNQCRWLKGTGMSTNYPLWIRPACAQSEYGLEWKQQPTQAVPEQIILDPEKAAPIAPVTPVFSESNLLPQNISHKSKDDKYVHAYAEEDGGSILYLSGKQHEKEMDFYLDPETIHKGLTNVGMGQISARTNLKNTTSHLNEKGKIDWTVYLSNGGERHYRKGPHLFKEKVLEEEIKPNGNKLHFSCCHTDKWGVALQKIISSSNDEKRNFGWLEVTYPKKGEDNQIEVHTSNDKFATYKYEWFKTEDKWAPFIVQAETSDQPLTTYEYSKCKGKRLMSKIAYPDHRYLKLEYDDEGRVIEERAPVGENNKAEAIYTFKYHPKKFFTSVYDANGIRTRYYITPSKCLNSIVKYDKNKKYLREERFVWGKDENIPKGQRDSSDEGHLMSRSVHCQKGAIFSTWYFYDDFGNITKEEYYGNFTGTAPKTYFRVHKKSGKPKEILETYRKYAKYNNDRFHMCVEKSEESGPTITFQYEKNTDLLTAKFTQDGDAIKIREFYKYDDDAVLIKKIVDDGSSHDPHNLKNVTERHITYITPVRDKESGGIGQPKEIAEYYLDMNSGAEVLLHRTHYQHSKDGRICDEKHFDAKSQERYTIKYKYHKLGNIKEKDFSAGDIQGKIYFYKYDENGNKKYEHLKDSGLKKYFYYDNANRLTSEVEKHDNGQTFTTTYTYDKASNKTSMIDRFGQKTSYEYDELGRCTKTIFPEIVDKDGNKQTPFTQTAYNVLNKPRTVTDENGHTTTYSCTARGQPFRITYPDGSSERFIYNKNGTLAKKTDRHGVEITYEYDFLRRVTKTTVAGTKITTHTYNAFHETSTTDPMGTTTYYTYDGAGRLIKKWVSGALTEYGYDELGRRNSTKEYLEDASYIEKCQTFDLYNRLIEEKTQHSDGTLLSLKKYSYDIQDNRTEEITYSSQDVTSTDRTEYNSQKLPIKHIDALGHTTLFEYDFNWKNELGHSVLKKKTIDPLGNQTIEIYDTLHRLDTVEKHSSKNELLAKTVFRYDLKGNKTKETEYVYADGALLREYIVEWTYTKTDLVETCTEQPGTSEEKKTSYSYTRGGLLETITKPDGVQVKHAYDEFARLSSISSSDGTVSYTYSYDLNDNVISVKDEKLQLTHTKTYDNQNRVTQDSIGTGVVTNFTYDLLDRVTGFSTGDSQVDYLYLKGRLHNVVRKDSSGTELYTHTYDSFDLRGNVTKSSPISYCGSIQFDWDPLSRQTHTTSDRFEETLTKFDDAGNLLEQTVRDPQGTITSTFSYDDLYQLVDEKGVLDATYKNDSLNNRLQKNDDPYTINTLNQLVSDNDTSYEYDKNGNPIQIGSMRLTYDALDRLILLERPGFSRTEYAYDESHRRISKKTSLWQEGSWHDEETLRFIFFNKREIGCLAPDNSTKEFRVLGLGKGAELGASVAIEVDGGIFCPLHDHRGNISLLIDTATNQPSDTYRYSAFGEETSFGSSQNPWQFASKRIDPESGFVFFGRRYYSPTVGRFITPDPLGFADGPNLYSYVHNSPLILVDPYGLWAEFSGHPSITDPYQHDSSNSLPFIDTSAQSHDSPTASASDCSPPPIVGITAGNSEGVSCSPQTQGGDSSRDQKILEAVQCSEYPSEEGLAEVFDNGDIAFFVLPMEKAAVFVVKGGGVLIMKAGSPLAKAVSYAGKTIAESKVGGLVSKVRKVAYEFFYGAEALQKANKFKEGEFSIIKWDGYPPGPKPKGPFRLVEGEEYQLSRNEANRANRAMHRENVEFKGKDIHDVHPVKFGGDPVDRSNKIALTREEHSRFTMWWNNFQNSITYDEG